MPRQGKAKHQQRAAPIPRTLLRLLLITLLLVGIAGAIVYWKRAAIRQFGNEWNADRHLAKARTELAEGAPEVALRRALTSHRLEPGRIDILRVLLRAARRANDSRLLAIGQALFVHPEATPEDRILGLAAINDTGDGLRFESFWKELEAETRKSPEALRERCRHLIREGRSESAIELLREADPREHPQLALLKVEALLDRDETDTDRRALELALSLLDDAPGNEIRVRLLNRLAEIDPSRIGSEKATRLEQWLDRLPVTAIDPSLPYALRVARSPDRRDAILREAVDDLRADHLDPLCQWLSRLGEHERIEKRIDEVQAYRSAVAYETRVRALIALDRLEDAFALLQYPPDVANRVGALVMRASVAGRLGRRSAETSAWQEALHVASRDMTRNHYLELARFAQAAGERRVAADALVAACRHPRGIMPPSDEIRWLVRYLIEQDRPGDLLAVCKRLLQSEAENPVLLNNAIYLSIILGGEGTVGDNVLELVDTLGEEHPDILGIRTTRALAHLMAGRPGEAREAFRADEYEGIGWQLFPASDRAIFAMVLQEDGPEELARHVRDVIDWSEMLEAERAFFRKHLSDNARSTGIETATADSSGDATGGGPNAVRVEGDREASASGDLPPSPRLQRLQERIAAEKAASEAGVVSPRSKLLLERLEKEKLGAESTELSPRARALRERRQPDSSEDGASAAAKEERAPVQEAR